MDTQMMDSVLSIRRSSSGNFEELIVLTMVYRASFVLYIHTDLYIYLFIYLSPSFG